MENPILSNHFMAKHESPTKHCGGYAYTLESVGEIYHPTGVVVTLPQTEYWVNERRLKKDVAQVEFERAPQGALYRRELLPEENQTHEVFIYEKKDEGWVLLTSWNEEDGYSNGNWPTIIIPLPEKVDLCLG